MNNYLNKTYIILDRELKGYFRTPLASIFLLVFLALSSGMTFFLGRFFERDQADLTAFFSWHPWLFLVLMPAIGMRLWAEERRSGTIELLITLPVTNTQLVVGKFLASWIFTLIALFLTMPIWITVNYLGEPDNHVILISYVGSWLMAGAFLALTSCLSALTKNQLVAAMACFTFCMLHFLIGFILQDLPVPELWRNGLFYVSTVNHVEVFINGLIDSRQLVYYLSFTALILLITYKILEFRKWKA